jgi:hypothetical protein
VFADQIDLQPVFSNLECSEIQDGHADEELQPLDQKADLRQDVLGFPPD